MLETLANCLEENDAYAQDAKHEEDFEAYFKDEDFKNLIEPILQRIELLTYRGDSLSKDDISDVQNQW